MTPELKRKRVALAMETARQNLINQPLARIWEQLASIAIAEIEKP